MTKGNEILAFWLSRLSFQLLNRHPVSKQQFEAQLFHFSSDHLLTCLEKQQMMAQKLINIMFLGHIWGSIHGVY